ncbi:hypothetical protein GGR53DRAFT_528115 [Hypoxylon sp. FL1150]|nr:hypothetical protein GGR53DRAFT_528115 [Hypoxylon sp. FL1150]
MATKNARVAAKARERGNQLYKERLFSQAVEAYEKASRLAPGDPTPLSNLSAIHFETGRYADCVDSTAKALGLLQPGAETGALRQRLLVRQARAYLHQSKLDEAEKLLDHVEPDKDLESLRGLVGGLREFDAFSSHPKLVRELLLQLPRTRPSIANTLDYFPTGNDNAESVYTRELAKSASNDPVLSLMFCGIGDARNLFQTVIGYNSSTKGAKGTQKLHITMLDINPAIIARDLIIFSLVNEVTSANPASRDVILLSLSYLYCTEIVPPFVWTKLQETIVNLLGSLREEKQPLTFLSIPVSQMGQIIQTLESWQQGPATAYKTSRVRLAIAEELLAKTRSLSKIGVSCPEHYPECKSDHKIFDEFRVLFPPMDVLTSLEPELSALDTNLHSSVLGAKKRVDDYLDKHWKVNVTLVDAKFQADQPPGALPYFGQDPFDTIKSLNDISPKLVLDENKSRYHVLKYAGRFFARLSLSILMLKDRLTIEVIVGEMADTLERLRYGHLDRYPQDHGGRGQESSSASMEWPQKYHVIHASNIPDYIGGSLTNFLYATPVLEEGGGTGVTSNVMRNPGKWHNTEHFNAEYLIMHDHAEIHKHFLVKKRMSMFFLDMRDYVRWERCQNGALPLEQLMPQKDLSKWLLAHFLKICLPSDRPADGSYKLVFAPNNMTVFIRLLVQMVEVGYPGHWLLPIISSLAAGSITTTVRAPWADELDSAADFEPTTIIARRPEMLDRVTVYEEYPSRTISVKPWTAEFTTLVTMWRGVLPFTIAAPSGMLPSPGTITEYAVHIPYSYHRIWENTKITVPHFALVFWNSAKYDEPPNQLRKVLLDDEKGDTTTSARKIRSNGIVMLSTYKWVRKTATATFWLRSDVVDNMLKENWKVCFWRIDNWKQLVPEISLKDALRRKRTWKECVTSS